MNGKSSLSSPLLSRSLSPHTSVEVFSNASFVSVDRNPQLYYSVPSDDEHASNHREEMVRCFSVCLYTLLLAALAVLASLQLRSQAAGATEELELNTLHHPMPAGPFIGPVQKAKSSVRGTMPPAPLASTTLRPQFFEMEKFPSAGVTTASLGGRAVQVNLPLGRLLAGVRKAAAWTGATTAVGVPSVVLLGNVFAHLEAPLLVDFFAGIVAAFCATCIMYPVDTMKTRIQLGKPSIPGGGLPHLYDGIGFAFAKDCPAAAVYITTFEMVRSSLSSVSGDALPAVGLFLLLLLSGAIGDFFGSIFALPMELVLKPIQAGQKVSVVQVLQSHGAAGILGCWKTVLMRDMPMGALQLAFFESLKAVSPVIDSDLHLPHFGTMMLLGGVAGAAAAFLTTPCDLLTSRMMTSHEHGKKANVGDLAREIYQAEGLRGFFRGCLMRSYYYAPEACIFFGIFESLTGFLNQ
eukprot:EG_transcript_7839